MANANAFPAPNYAMKGGFRTGSIYSGSAALNDQLLYSGAGRLNLILAHQQPVSGVQVTFYDAGVATSGGPFPLSGHKIVGVIPANIPANLQSVIEIEIPFTSGLCVATKSGQPGFTYCYTPEQPLQ